MRPIVTIYIAVGVLCLLFGNITGDLLSLGIRGEYVNIAEKSIGAAVLFVGAYALANGVTLPTLPGKDEPPE